MRVNATVCVRTHREPSERSRGKREEKNDEAQNSLSQHITVPYTQTHKSIELSAVASIKEKTDEEIQRFILFKYFHSPSLE